ncbi:hypothetical protein H4R35_001309 [Dimargaris xerosporica]|nr:hypothetical protein H4R35_001309 [Dimargaris xerosporica]
MAAGSDSHPEPAQPPTLLTNAAPEAPVVDDTEPSLSINDQGLEELSRKYFLAKSQQSRQRELNKGRLFDQVFDENNPQIKQDILQMIIQFLDDEGYEKSKQYLCDEASIKQRTVSDKIEEIKKLKAAVLAGNWDEVDRLCTKSLVKHQKSFLYLVYRQQFLEHIELHEYQQAYTCLNARLKPLEYLQTTDTEFKDLCYLLTCKSVQDVPSFRQWEGISTSRERLSDHLQQMIDYETIDRDVPDIPPRRLLTLLRQAAIYQIQTSHYLPDVQPTVKTLIQDYSSFVIPNSLKSTLVGHRANIKCAIFVGPSEKYIASGSSDNDIRLWDAVNNQCICVLKGHTSKVWDLCSSYSQTMLASASGDRTVKVWDIRDGSDCVCTATLTGHDGDVYSVDYHPRNPQIASCGYDKTIRLFDVTTGILLKAFTGHELSVSQTVFNPLGNLIVSGSKDKTIKFWDILSGTCIKTISVHLGEVTSVAMNHNGTLLLSSSKDNSTRLWDVRMMKPIQRFKGHQNISKNFIRSGFAHNSLVMSGSEVKQAAGYGWMVF